MKQWIEFTPAFDGIGAVTLTFYVKGELGAVQFSVGTNWHLPNVGDELAWKAVNEHAGDSSWLKTFFTPSGSDLGFHSPIPMFEGQEAIGSTEVDFQNMTLCTGSTIPLPAVRQTGTYTPCPLLDGRKCYYDGSGLQAIELLKVLIAEGSNAVWPALEERYISQFGELK